MSGNRWTAKGKSLFPGSPAYTEDEESNFFQEVEKNRNTRGQSNLLESKDNRENISKEGVGIAFLGEI